MNISPINNTNFKSKIQNTKLLQEGFELAKKSIDRSEMKSMNYAKDFFDNIELIHRSDKAKVVKFELDNAANEAVAYADGEKKTVYQIRQNECTGYSVIQAVKKYAESLNISPVTTLLDKYKMNVEFAKNEYRKAHEAYQVTLEAVWNDLAKNL